MSEYYEIAQEAMKIGRQELENSIKQELKSSKINTKTVIQALNDFELLYKQYRALLSEKRRLKSINPNSDNLSQIRETIKKFQLETYEKFFKFQNLFNEYFQQRIQMLFVYRNESGEFKLGLLENDLSHVIINKYGSLEYNVDQIQSIMKLEIAEYDSTSLNETANEIYRRWDIAKSVYHKSVGLPILWHINGRWNGRKVNNKGTIAEAYANFYIHQIILEGDIENRVQTYVIDKEYGMLSVDNTLGFVVGDINAGQIQYAVKSQRAGLMGMYQVYKSIQNIKNLLNSGLEEEALKKLFEQTSQKGTVKQVQTLSEHIEKEHDKLIETYFKDLTNQKK